jgi:predicted site-specific integrase-resolvase
MTVQTQNTELQKVEEVTIALPGAEYLSLRNDFETLQIQHSALQEHVKTSMEYSLKRSHAYEVQQAIMRRHLGKMLDEHEAIFNRFGKFESVEFASDYIEAATAAKHTGRKDDLIKEVTEWMNSESSLPFNRTCRVSKQYPVQR